MESTTSRPRARAYVAVTAWAAVGVLCGSLLLARLLLTVPTPAPSDPALRQALAARRRPEQRDRGLVRHALAKDCCAPRVLDPLLVTPRPLGVRRRTHPVLAVRPARRPVVTRDVKEAL